MSHAQFICLSVNALMWTMLDWGKRLELDPPLPAYLCSNSTPTLTGYVNMSDSAGSNPFLSTVDKKWSFWRVWNNGLDHYVGCVCQWVVTFGKSWEFAEIFTLPSSLCFLAARKLQGGFKNPEVRLLISRNRGHVCQKSWGVVDRAELEH